jgi:hypothetical protein
MITHAMENKQHQSQIETRLSKTVQYKKKNKQKLKGPKFNKGQKGSRSNIKKKWIQKNLSQHQEKLGEEKRVEAKVGIEKHLDDPVESKEPIDTTSSSEESINFWPSEDSNDSSNHDEPQPEMEDPAINIQSTKDSLHPVFNTFQVRAYLDLEYNFNWLSFIIMPLITYVINQIYKLLTGQIFDFIANIWILYMALCIFSFYFRKYIVKYFYHRIFNFFFGWTKKLIKIKMVITDSQTIYNQSLLDTRNDSMKRVQLKHPNPHLHRYAVTYQCPKFMILFNKKQKIYIEESKVSSKVNLSSTTFLNVSKEIFSQIKSNRVMKLNVDLSTLYEKVNYACDNINTVNIDRYYSDDVVTDTALYSYYYAIKMRQERGNLVFPRTQPVIE